MKAELLIDINIGVCGKLDLAAGSKLKDAVSYVWDHKRCSNTFLERGEVEISN